MHFPVWLARSNGSLRGNYFRSGAVVETSSAAAINPGGRTTGMGYSGSGDNNRRKFTGYERDSETGLDFAEARYYSATQGRFTRPDPLMASAKAGRPQSWNRYAYCFNNPVRHTDPSGMSVGMLHEASKHGERFYGTSSREDFVTGGSDYYSETITWSVSVTVSEADVLQQAPPPSTQPPPVDVPESQDWPPSRDNETGLDFAQARYDASAQGRFTSPYPLMASASAGRPQSWNRYAYCFNNPVRHTDPSGMAVGMLHEVSKHGERFYGTSSREDFVTGGSDYYEGVISDRLSQEAITNTLLDGGDPPPAGADDPATPQKPIPAPGPDPTEHSSLTPCNKSRLAPYFPGVDLDKVQIRFGFDSLTKFTGGGLNAVGIQVLNGATAITVGSVITFRSRSDYNPDSIQGIALIGHETTHVGQEQAGRFGDFQYVREYLNNRALGMSDYQAYRNISTEREAFKMQGVIQKDLENLKKQLGGDAFWAPCPPH
jgi:RHS repeat-associated protein